MIDYAAILAFRADLPKHRRGWFDTLRLEDQARIAGVVRC